MNEEPAVFTRAIGRRAFLRTTAALSAGGAAAWALACSGSGGGDATSTPETSPTFELATPSPGGIQPRRLTSEFVVNEPNRFLIGLLGPDGRLVEEAGVNLRFYKIGADNTTGTFRRSGDATFLKLSVPGAHAHDSTGDDLANDSEVSFYGAVTPFEEAGPWGVELTITPKAGGTKTQLQLPFDVLAAYKTPANGAQAPASVNDTVQTTTDPANLCSRDPQCPLHDKVIADLVGKGRPLVVQFSTPAFCETRFCGPVLEVLLEQVPAYQDRIDFVHIEVWQDYQLKKLRPAIGDWKLESEPYTFFVKGDGTVASRLEAIFTSAELKQELDKLVAV
jgi:hypothetical protein